MFAIKINVILFCCCGGCLLCVYIFGGQEIVDASDIISKRLFKKNKNKIIKHFFYTSALNNRAYFRKNSLSTF